MAQKKFRPKSGNPAKAAEELRAFKEQADREEQERAVARQERREALAEGRWDVETHGMFKSAPKEAVPQPFSFNVKNDGSSSGVSYTPKTTLTPASKSHSEFVPRTDLDDVIDPQTVVQTTKSGKVKPVMPKAEMTKRKVGQIALAGIGLTAMLATAVIIPVANGSMSVPGFGQDTEGNGVITDENGNVVLVDRNGVPIGEENADIDFGTDTSTGVVPLEDAPPAADPSAVPSPVSSDAVEPKAGE